MGLRSFLRGDWLDEQRSFGRYGSTTYGDATYSVAPAENQWPLTTSFTKDSITPVQALGIGDVWAAVRVLADAASSLPLHVYRKGAQGREQVTSGKLVDLLDRPSPAVTQADIISTLMVHLAVWGDGYIAKYRDQGEVAQLGLLYPDRVVPESRAGEVRWRYTPPTGNQVMLNDADVIQVRGLSVDGVTGLSAVSQASRVLGLSDELVKHARSYFDVGGSSGIQRPAGVLKLGDPGGMGGNLGSDRTHDDLRNRQQRPHDILVVTGDAEYTPIAQRMDDAQFVEQRRLATQEVARVFRIPSHMLNAGSGGDSLTYSTTEQLAIDFVRYSLQPWLRRIELAISGDTDLAFQRQYVRFEVDGLLRADAKTRAEIYALALDPVNGWMNRDEVRRLEDLEPEPEPTPAQAMTQAVQAAMPQPQGMMSNGNG